MGACGRIAFDPMVAGRDAAADASTDIAIDAGLPPGLVAWYPLDDAPGATTFRDVIGGHDGGCTFGTCPTSAPGHHGTAMHFDGAMTCIDIADAGQLDLPAFTITIWGNQEVAASSVGMTQYAKRVDVAGMARDSWQLEDGSAGELQFTTNHGATSNEYAYAPSPPPTIVLGTWQHFAGTWDGTTTRIYANGVQVAFGNHTAPIAYDTHPGLIGCDDNVGVSETYQGTLDDMQIYNRALTDTEIAQLAGM